MPRATPASYSPAPLPAPRSKDAVLKAPAPAPAFAAGSSKSGFHVKAEKGDTLSVLSRRYGVPVEAIQSANNLPDGRLAIGQDIFIPTSAKPRGEVAAAPKAVPKPVSHAVAEKEPEQSPSTPSSAAPAVRVVKTTTITAPGAAQSAPKPASGTPSAEPTGNVAASSEVTGEPKTSIASTTQLPSPDPMSGNSFRWPVRGRVVSTFGTKPDGGHNDGIDLAVPQGTSVRAAENGVVAYAGDELKGYGNLVLIRHANNWVSAYAHNEEILVKRGDKVTRGQVIAKAGATGAVDRPQVHFELRKGSRPVDPTKYMSSATVSAD
jgi:murein DD-endopeptidase MepM/ murein hydrolase activator NlpD